MAFIFGRYRCYIGSPNNHLTDTKSYGKKSFLTFKIRSSIKSILSSKQLNIIGVNIYLIFLRRFVLTLLLPARCPFARWAVEPSGLGTQLRKAITKWKTKPSNVLFQSVILRAAVQRPTGHRRDNWRGNTHVSGYEIPQAAMLNG